MGKQLTMAPERTRNQVLSGEAIRKVMEEKGLAIPSDTLYVKNVKTRARELIEPDKTYDLADQEVEVLPWTGSGEGKE